MDSTLSVVQERYINRFKENVTPQQFNYSSLVHIADSKFHNR
jgi:hypothetical protein